jgi:hypothetical protein
MFLQEKDRGRFDAPWQTDTVKTQAETGTASQKLEEAKNVFFTRVFGGNTLILLNETDSGLVFQNYESMHFYYFKLLNL